MSQSIGITTKVQPDIGATTCEGHKVPKPAIATNQYQIKQSTGQTPHNQHLETTHFEFVSPIGDASREGWLDVWQGKV